MTQTTNTTISLNNGTNNQAAKIRQIGIKHWQVRRALELLHNKRPNPERLFVVEGLWAHEMILESGIAIESFLSCPTLIYSETARSVYRKAESAAESIYHLSEKAFKRICERDRPDGLISICRFPYFSIDDIPCSKNATVLVLDGLEIPGNIGTLIRTVDGAGAAGIIICNRKARLTHPKILRASHGMNFSIPIVECCVETASQWLDKNGYTVHLADANTKEFFYERLFSGRNALVLGNERYGLSKEWNEKGYKSISIPMKGRSDSLNVAVAGSIILYEMCSRYGR